MTRHPIHRTLALLVSAALLASLAVATTATAVSAKPKCGGKVATIVGTSKSEVIVGTNGNDVIVAKGGNDLVRGRGGHDRICGGRGQDVLFGNGGHDRLYGQLGPDHLVGNQGRDLLVGNAGNDHFDGSAGSDGCYQGVGTGVVLNCERPDPDPVLVRTPFYSTCERLGGTYRVSSQRLAPDCEWTGMSLSEWETAVASLMPLCPRTLAGGSMSKHHDPDFVGCAIPGMPARPVG
jgi:hypothetical protein